MLCLTHVSGRYFGKELRAEAREVFANTELPRDFDVVELPFPGTRNARFWSKKR